MKKFIKKYFVFLLVLPFFFSSCDGLLPEGGGKPPVIPARQVAKQSIDQWKNSAEITAEGTPLNIGDATNLYTITVHYPQGDYDGTTNTASFSLKGSGSTHSANPNIVLKSTPSGNSKWQDLIVGNYTTEADYWFTDVNNKIKYYRSKEAISEAFTPKFNNSETEYWQPIKERLLNGVFNENIFEGERESFGIKAYDKSKMGYFNVIFADLGANTVAVGGGVAGTAGQYQSANIRPGNTSNESDIFYVNNRYFEACCKTGVSTPSGAADTIMTTLVHEYMHYLMDSHILLEAEKEYADSLDPDTGTVSSSGGYNSLEKMYSSNLTGSLFWIEGCANYAPYRMINSADKNAVSSWLGDMKIWRPDLNTTVTNATNAGNSYAVYGSGGLFMSYIAERYGTDTINAIHKYRTKGSDLSNLSRSDMQKRVGNLNYIFPEIVKKPFKDVYLNYLMQCMSSLSDKVCMKDCVEDFKCITDWGFNTAAIQNAEVVNSAVSGYNYSGLPELSFVINRWNEIPEKLTLEGDNVKCYAVWF